MAHTEKLGAEAGDNAAFLDAQFSSHENFSIPIDPYLRVEKK